MCVCAQAPGVADGLPASIPHTPAALVDVVPPASPPAAPLPVRFFSMTDFSFNLFFTTPLFCSFLYGSPLPVPFGFHVFES